MFIKIKASADWLRHPIDKYLYTFIWNFDTHHAHRWQCYVDAFDEMYMYIIINGCNFPDSEQNVIRMLAHQRNEAPTLESGLDYMDLLALCTEGCVPNPYLHHGNISVQKWPKIST